MGEAPGVQDLNRLVHDIKTPVNIILGRLQMAVNRMDGEAAAKRNVVQAIAGAHNLLRKFYNLYYLVSLNADPGFPQSETVSLPEAWAESSKHWAGLAEVRGATLDAETTSVLRVCATREILIRMFDNLLSNALLHPKNVKLVSFAVERNDDMIDMVFRNDGCDSEEEGEVDIPEPDFAEGLTVNRLGLPAVKALAARMSGRFDARREPGGHFKATLSLPVGE